MNNSSLIQRIETNFQTEFEKLNIRQRYNLLFILNYSLLGKNYHELYSKNDEVFILVADYMRKKINFRNWKTIIKPFFILSNPKFYKGTARGWTYSYKLKKIINSHQLNENYIRENNKQNEIKINVEQGLEDAKLLMKLVMLGSDGIDEYNRIFKPKKEITTLAELKARKNGLIMILENVNTISYEEKKTGRLFLISASNLQKFYSELRNRLFKDMGYYDYDIVNAHYTLLREWMNTEGFKTDEYICLNKYINQRDEIIDELSNQFKLSKGKIKEIFLALLNSGVNNNYNSVFEDMKKSKIDDVLSHSFIINLKKEIAEIKELVYYYHFNSGIVRNKVMAHLLQNLESQVLNIICSEYSNSIVLKMFDGWVSNEKISVQEIERLVKTKIGYGVKFKEVNL
ncbi:MAG: hypothetical protein PHN88_09100 [Ignavibacteria bacterium]|nr:hypothetical protein [Ignavibacteria bacterium]